MIRVAGKDEVDPGGWQQWIVWFRKNHFNVSNSVLFCLLCDQIVHRLVNIYSVNFAVGTDRLSKRKDKVAPTGSNVGNPISGTYLK
jgi:hypothetical protein